jgi:hypothetical protein
MVIFARIGVAGDTHPYERFFSMTVEDARRALRIAEAPSAQG